MYMVMNFWVAQKENFLTSTVAVSLSRRNLLHEVNSCMPVVNNLHCDLQASFYILSRDWMRCVLLWWPVVLWAAAPVLVCGSTTMMVPYQSMIENNFISLCNNVRQTVLVSAVMWVCYCVVECVEEWHEIGQERRQLCGAVLEYSVSCVKCGILVCLESC